MSSNRIWTIGAAVVILGVLVATWFLGVSPQITAAGAAATERTDVEAQNQVQEAALNALKKQFDELDTIKADLDDARKVVPSARDKSLFSKQIDQLSTKYGITITSLAFADPKPFVPYTSDDPELGGALAQVNEGNFLVIQVDITAIGPTKSMMAFVQAMQTGERLYLLHDLSMTEAVYGGNNEIDVALSGEVFVLLDAASVPVPEATETPAPVDEG